jgi:putative molybdopterin biosynthesis protein
MNDIQPIRTFEQIKLLADSRRMEIVRLLMGQAATLSQIGRAIGKHPAWVQHHIKALEAGGLVEISEVRVTAGVTEKFYRARASGFLLQEMILPQGEKPTLVFSGSHDLALERLAERLSSQLTLLTLPVGSLNGLVNLRQGLCQISGAHILDESGGYNTATVRHLFPEHGVGLVTLAWRTQGLLLAPGNPKDVRSLFDLGREDITFLNRNPGSGTRIWLERELARIGQPFGLVRGFENFVHTHSEAARAIRHGKADVSLGIQAAAREHGLAFLPLFEERYDLVLSLEAQSRLAPLLDDLQTASFRHIVESLSGYSATHCGEQVQF